MPSAGWVTLRKENAPRGEALGPGHGRRGGLLRVGPRLLPRRNRAGDARLLGRRVQVRDRIARLARELHAAHCHERDGEAVHTVADVGLGAVRAHHVAGET